MKAIVALEELIKEDEAHIKLVKKQLADHESGANKLSNMVKATAENTLEETTSRLEKHKLKLNELLKLDIQELEKEERLRDAVTRKNYFHYQKTRIKRDIIHASDEKLEAMHIIDELPEGAGIEDEILFNIAEKSLKLHLSVIEDVDEKLKDITEDFNNIISDIPEDEIGDLGLLNKQITVLVLHFSVLVSNIETILEEKENPNFSGFPKYEDWWIKELWINHQAYFGLFKWKEIISKLCITTDQKIAWDGMCANWISIKRYLHSKGSLAYNYTYAFDTIMKQYAGLEEELSSANLESMEKLINTLTQKEDFSQIKSQIEHKFITPYLEFKREKSHYKETK